MPKLKGISFETAIIEGYRRRESSVEETLIEMYLAGVSVRRVEDITEALWGSKVSPSTISELNKKAYVHIEDWRNRPLQGGRYPYVYVDGIYLRRNWGGEFENVAILVAIAVNEDGYRDVLGAAEGMKEDKSSWVSFFQWLRGRGLDGVKLVIGDKCLGMLEAVGEVFPEAKYQRCTVHFYRNVFSATPRSKMKLVAKMLKAIHSQESKKAAREKAKAVVEELHSMKLKEAAKKVEDGIEETLTYMNLRDAPHAMYAGATNSGKSMSLICLILSLIYYHSVDSVNLILCDMGGRSLSVFEDTPHLSHPIVYDEETGAYVISSLFKEMERRLALNEEEIRDLPSIVCVLSPLWITFAIFLTTQ